MDFEPVGPRPLSLLTADSFSGVPIYRLIADRLRARIEAGEWKPGDAIPTEAQLASVFNASTGTVKKALELLVADSLLIRQRGRGTFIARANLEGSLTKFFRRFVGDDGNEYNPLTRIVKLAVVKCPKTVAARLAIGVGDLAIHLERLRLIGDTPLMVEHSYLPQQLFPGLEREDLSANLLYRVLEEKYDCPVVRADEFLLPDLASTQEGRNLGIPEKSPVIVIERLVYSSNDRPIEYRRCVGRGDKYRLHVRLR